MAIPHVNGKSTVTTVQVKGLNTCITGVSEKPLSTIPSRYFSEDPKPSLNKYTLLPAFIGSLLISTPRPAADELDDEVKEMVEEILSRIIKAAVSVGEERPDVGTLSLIRQRGDPAIKYATQFVIHELESVDPNDHIKKLNLHLWTPIFLVSLGNADTLLPYLQSPNPDVQSVIIQALWGLGDRKATPYLKTTPYLLPFLKGEDTGLMYRSIQALGTLGDRSAVPSITPFLSHPDPSVRREAAFALGHLADPSSFELLLAYLASKDMFDKLLAIGALKQLADPRALEPLLHCLEDSEEEVRQAARKAIAQIVKKNPRITVSPQRLSNDGKGRSSTERVKQHAETAYDELESITGNDAEKIQPSSSPSMASAIVFIGLIHLRGTSLPFEEGIRKMFEDNLFRSLQNEGVKVIQPDIPPIIDEANIRTRSPSQCAADIIQAAGYATGMYVDVEEVVSSEELHFTLSSVTPGSATIVYQTSATVPKRSFQYSAGVREVAKTLAKDLARQLKAQTQD